MLEISEKEAFDWEASFREFVKITKEFQKDGVKVLFFQTPLIRNIKNLSDFEKERLKHWQFDFNNISDEDYSIIAKVYGNNIDKNYLKKVYDGTKVYLKDGIKYLADFRSDLVNIINGERFTVCQPELYKKAIYIYGQCTARGTGVEDKNTIPSFLQKYINEQYRDILVRNRAIGCGSTILDDIEHAKLDHKYQKQGDLAIFCTDFRIIPAERFAEYGIMYFDCSHLFDRPNNYGEWFTDATFHTTPEGNQIIGKYIFSVLDSFGALNTSENALLRTVAEFERDIPFDEDVIEGVLSQYDSFKRPGECHGAVIMNCNPFTYGHRYLIETAASQVDWLYIFVVEEDKSFFKFKDRIELVRRGISNINNISVLPSGRFILSADTFPGYFYKDDNTDINVDSSIDVRIFGKYVAPLLNISVRFIGEEPIDPVTALYNRQMHEILPSYGIEVREIKRIESEGMPISASQVRKLLVEKRFDEIRDIVPDTTYRFLKENYG